jgi:hypothetical protein
MPKRSLNNLLCDTHPTREFSSTLDDNGHKQEFDDEEFPHRLGSHPNKRRYQFVVLNSPSSCTSGSSSPSTSSPTRSNTRAKFQNGKQNKLGNDIITTAGNTDPNQSKSYYKPHEFVNLVASSVFSFLFGGCTNNNKDAKEQPYDYIALGQVEYIQNNGHLDKQTDNSNDIVVVDDDGSASEFDPNYDSVSNAPTESIDTVSYSSYLSDDSSYMGHLNDGINYDEDESEYEITILKKSTDGHADSILPRNNSSDSNGVMTPKVTASKPPNILTPLLSSTKKYYNYSTSSATSSIPSDTNESEDEIDTIWFRTKSQAVREDVNDWGAKKIKKQPPSSPLPAIMRNKRIPNNNSEHSGLYRTKIEVSTGIDVIELPKPQVGEYFGDSGDNDSDNDDNDNDNDYDDDESVQVSEEEQVNNIKKTFSLNLYTNKVNKITNINCDKKWTLYDLFTNPNSILSVHNLNQKKFKKMLPQNAARIVFITPTNKKKTKTQINHVFTQPNETPSKKRVGNYQQPKLNIKQIKLVDFFAPYFTTPLQTETIPIRLRWDVYPV